MRLRLMLEAAPLLAGVIAAMGCQVIAGIDGLEVTSSAGAGGGAGGAACKVASDCGAVTDCGDVACEAGQCKVTSAKMGSPCGGKCASDEATPPGTCDGAGHCSTQPAPCPAHYGCNAAGTACADHCDMSGGCSKDGVCFMGPMACMACGAVGMAGPCPPVGCESCDAPPGVCSITCDSPGECTSDRALNAMGTPVRLDCGDQCDNITVTCNGAAPCEVTCKDGCNNLKLQCGLDGPCSLTCNGKGCVNAAVTCGGNTCALACKASPVTVAQECGRSCDCTRVGCL